MNIFAGLLLNAFLAAICVPLLCVVRTSRPYISGEAPVRFLIRLRNVATKEARPLPHRYCFQWFLLQRQSKLGAKLPTAILHRRRQRTVHCFRERSATARSSGVVWRPGYSCLERCHAPNSRPQPVAPSFVLRLFSAPASVPACQLWRWASIRSADSSALEGVNTVATELTATARRQGARPPPGRARQPPRRACPPPGRARPPPEAARPPGRAGLPFRGAVLRSRFRSPLKGV